MAGLKDGMLQPAIYRELPLYESKDVIAHKNNVVTESSPCMLNGVIYIASGSGHVMGYDLSKKEMVWDFFIGSDIDGSAVVTSDSCLLVSVEKQYIRGPGGVFKLNPAKQPEEAVVWYFPVENYEYAGWEGGIIGSVGINDFYNDGTLPFVAAFSAIDGNLYVVNHKELVPGTRVIGPDSLSTYSTPVLLFKKTIGPSISTPVVVKDKILAASYHAIYLLQYNRESEFIQLDKFLTAFEATPVVNDKKVYIASRDGYFYCLGNVR
jgi:outer membrane protein assembly factor BamB